MRQSEMEEAFRTACKACEEGNVQVVKKFLSSHPESVNWVPVSNPIDVNIVQRNDDFVFILISFLILHFFYRKDQPPYRLPVTMATKMSL